MLTKSKEKALAVQLRKSGKSYSEILDILPVAKSTLSLWLREVGLSKKQKQKISDRKRAAQQRGGAKRREIRLAATKELHDQCVVDIAHITNRELFLIGVSLYWAEGFKQTENRTNATIDFANSDPAMVQLFIRWLVVCAQVSIDDVVVRLHLHDSFKSKEWDIKNYWSKITTVPLIQFSNTNFKKHNPTTKRKNRGQEYKGLVAIRVKNSTVLNRRIQGWIRAIIATQN